MIAHSNEQIKKQLPTPLHLHLHRAAALKRAPAPNNQRQIMRPQPGLGIRSIGVCISCTGEDSRHVNAGMQALFAQGKALENWEGVFFCCAAGFC